MPPKASKAQAKSAPGKASSKSSSAEEIASLKKDVRSRDLEINVLRNKLTPESFLKQTGIVDFQVSNWIETIQRLEKELAGLAIPGHSGKLQTNSGPDTDKLQEELVVLKRDNENLRIKVIQAQSDAKQANDDRNHIHGKFLELKEKQKESELQLLSQKSPSDSNSQATSDLLDQIDTLKKDNQELQSQSDQAKEQAGQVKTAMEQCQQQLSQMQEELQRRQQLTENTKTNLENEISQLKQQLATRTSEVDAKSLAPGNASVEQAEKRLKESESKRQELETCKSEMKSEIKELKRNIDNVNKQLDDEKGSCAKMENDMKEVKLQLEAANKNLSDKENEVKHASDLADKYKEMAQKAERQANAKSADASKRSEIDDKKQEIDRLNENIKQMKKENEDKTFQISELKETINKLRKEAQIPGSNGSNKELNEAYNEIEELKNRLSKVVGAKITDNNPAIADLSDENRPTKLGEKYSELYDNQWTDAFEEEEKATKANEPAIIKKLYTTLTDVDTFCQNVSVKYTDSLQKCALCLPGQSNGVTHNDGDIPLTKRRLLKELKKGFAPYLIDQVFMEYKKSKNLKLDKNPCLQAFIKGCIDVCWLMSVQDPPVVIDTKNTKSGTSYDTDRFRAYTKTGKVLDYVVWAPLQLNKDGPMLAKGVAQAK